MAASPWCRAWSYLWFLSAARAISVSSFVVKQAAGFRTLSLRDNRGPVALLLMRNEVQ